VFIPLSDDNPLKVIPFQIVTVGLIIINIAVFVLTSVGPDSDAVIGFAVVPNELFLAGTSLVPVGPNAGMALVPEPYTLATYMFFHADIFHLAGNMIFLWVFGDNVEDAVGHVKFLLFYLACGIAAALTHAVLVAGTENADVPLIGASGAVAGVISAYLMLHPRVRVWVLAFKVIPLQISAALALGAWIVIQVVMVLMPEIGPVAWWAHIGGLIAGAVLIIFMRRPGVELFDRQLPRRVTTS
jgi:membrane associated rhomboid family serine protease